MGMKGITYGMFLVILIKFFRIKAVNLNIEKYDSFLEVLFHGFCIESQLLIIFIYEYIHTYI